MSRRMGWLGYASVEEMARRVTVRRVTMDDETMVGGGGGGGVEGVEGG